MPRPSLAEERTEMILIAIRYCVAKYGLDGATQERISDAAGMKRPMLRHYLGNRDAMIDSFIDHMAKEFDGQTDWLVESLPENDRLEVLLDILFGPVGESDTETLLATQAIIASADQHPKARAMLVRSIHRFREAIVQELATAFPASETSQQTVVAQAIANLHFSVDGLTPLKPPSEWRVNAKRAAEILIGTLEQK